MSYLNHLRSVLASKDDFKKTVIILTASRALSTEPLRLRESYERNRLLDQHDAREILDLNCDFLFIEQLGIDGPNAYTKMAEKWDTARSRRLIELSMERILFELEYKDLVIVNLSCFEGRRKSQSVARLLKDTIEKLAKEGTRVVIENTEEEVEPKVIEAWDMVIRP